MYGPKVIFLKLAQLPKDKIKTSHSFTMYVLLFPIYWNKLLQIINRSIEISCKSATCGYAFKIGLHMMDIIFMINLAKTVI